MKEAMADMESATSSAKADQDRVQGSFQAMDDKIASLEKQLQAEIESSKDKVQQINILSMRLADSNEQADNDAIEADNLRDAKALLEEQLAEAREVRPFDVVLFPSFLLSFFLSFFLSVHVPRLH